MKKILNLTYNLLKLKFSNASKPVMLSLYITNKCNLRCSYCFIQDEKVPQEVRNSEFTLEEIKKIIDDFYRLGTRMIFLLGGEPLVHKKFGEIVEYIHRKGIVIHVNTNGTLIDKKIDELKFADGICVSLDGIGEANDSHRGKGVYELAISNIEKAKSVGLKCRIHSMLTRANLHKFEELVHVAKELGVMITISPAHYIEAGNNKELIIKDDEYRAFWGKYYELKKQGYPIGNSLYTIEAMINWPLGYGEIMMKNAKLPEGYQRPIPCVNSKYYVGLSADGILHYCLKPGMLIGPNVKDVGVLNAWETLVKTRPDCYACASTNTIEYSLSSCLHKSAIANAIKFQLFR
ncbi:MAG: radical SAM protein [Proteobacteria bacterium]|nr:radical SAM protein [Pseudomonadota bacterium]